jgi:hypothetical protein
MDVTLPGKIYKEYMEPAYAPNNYELVPVLILNQFLAFRLKIFFIETDFQNKNDETFYSKIHVFHPHIHQ